MALHHIEDAAALTAALSEPSDALVGTMSRLTGDLLILGAGGKMGPSFALMARRAIDAAGVNKRVIAVSRFTNDAVCHSLRDHGVDVLRGDLFDAEFVRSLPNAANVLYLVGMKFGGAGALGQTWASNTYVTGNVAERFSASRIVALSTGNVYAFSPVETSKGSVETDMPAPVGEYAMSALGRERVFQFFSERHGTPLAIIRLNYAAELRYGVLVDLAKQVFAGETVPLAMGYFNVIWQRDACDQILRSFEYASSLPRILNVTGPTRVSSREVCQRFGKLLGRDVRFEGKESPTALLSDASQAIELFGLPATSLDDMISMTANWIQRGGETWNKPTRFQVRDGKF
jgi:nucleoside-diphosphate-sugar epimerase